MIKLITLSEAVAKLKNEDLDIDLVNDILYELFIFDKEYTRASSKELILLNFDEEFQPLNFTPKSPIEDINGTMKFFYVQNKPKRTQIVYRCAKK